MGTAKVVATNRGGDNLSSYRLWYLVIAERSPYAGRVSRALDKLLSFVSTGGGD